MIVDDSADREAMWSRLSPAAKEQFFWVTPGLALGEGDSVPSQSGVPSTMVLVKLVPESVDHLVLAKEQERQRHTETGDGWRRAASIRRSRWLLDKFQRYRVARLQLCQIIHCSRHYQQHSGVATNSLSNC